MSEGRNRTLLDMVRSMMGFASLPISFRGYALESAYYLLNRVPSKSVIRTPYEKKFEAMKSEMKSMKVNDVWTVVDPPKGVKPIGCKWVFKRKRDADRKVETYKARLVAKGYRQCYGIDYDEMFSPVTMLKFIRIMLVIATHLDYESGRWMLRPLF